MNRHDDADGEVLFRHNLQRRREYAARFFFAAVADWQDVVETYFFAEFIVGFDFAEIQG